MKAYLVIALVVIALSGALWRSVERNMKTSAELASASDALNRKEQEHKATKDKLFEVVAARDRLADRIWHIESVEADLEAKLDAERAKRATLEKENEIYRNWAGTDLPGAVVRMLRESPLYTGHRLPGVRERETAGNSRAAPQSGVLEKERQPAGSD
ncbi:hypothetical protein [Marinobacter sp. X15-166B]|uniref:hypothetical protein n=1 Tax=Marinobacter sp. X15-166B TaxID=1897620 RepID=UPI00114CF0ED|nr:hypothetical protein [Marinobacter sp. X15-166B]